MCATGTYHVSCECCLSKTMCWYYLPYPVLKDTLAMGAALKNNLATVLGITKSNDLEPHFQICGDTVAVLRGHENCCRFCHSVWSESTKGSIAGWCTFRIRGEAGVMAELRNIAPRK